MTIPIINSVGVFKVKTPFTLTADTKYTCIAIENFAVLRKKSIDVFATYYQPVGLSKEIYLEDLEKDVSIVTLSDNTDILTRIPTSYILSAPALAIVPYSQTYITFNLKALPDGLNLTSTLLEAQALMEANLGITANYKVLTLPVKEAITATEDIALEAARAANINLKPSARKDLADALAEIAVLREKINDYEEIFIDMNA